MTITIPATTSMSSWAAERRHFGLIVQRTEVIQDETGRSLVVLVLDPHTTAGEVVTIAEPEAEQQADYPVEADLPTQPAKLDDLIPDMLARAAADPGIPKRATLGRGLRIDLMVKDAQIHLQLSRLGVFPSEQEWKTVIKRLGDAAATAGEPGKKTYQGRRYLAGTWTRTEASSE